MNRSWLMLAAVVVVAVAAGGVYFATGGSTVPAGIWLQSDQDPASTQVNLAVFAACDGN